MGNGPSCFFVVDYHSEITGKVDFGVSIIPNGEFPTQC